MKLFYLGCDVSKGYADFVIINDEKECVEENYQLDDTAEGHQKLLFRLERFFENHPDSTLCAAVESNESGTGALCGFQQAVLNQADAI